MANFTNISQFVNARLHGPVSNCYTHFLASTPRRHGQVCILLPLFATSSHSSSFHGTTWATTLHLYCNSGGRPAGWDPVPGDTRKHFTRQLRSGQVGNVHTVWPQNRMRHTHFRRTPRRVRGLLSILSAALIRTPPTALSGGANDACVIMF